MVQCEEMLQKSSRGVVVGAIGDSENVFFLIFFCPTLAVLHNFTYACMRIGALLSFVKLTILNIWAM